MSDTGTTTTGTEVTDGGSQVDPQAQTKDGANTTSPESTPQQLAEEATAKVSRMEQEVAKYAKVMKGLGIDPDSDTAEHLRTGMITRGDYVRSITPSEATATPTSTPPAP